MALSDLHSLGNKEYQKQARLLSSSLHANLNLKANFSVLHSICTPGSSPHECKASKSHWRRLEAGFINRQAQVTVVCNFQTKFLTAET